MSDEGFYTKKMLRAVVCLSNTQIDRLERRGRFPKRVVLSGTARNSRIGWVKKEIHYWVLERVAAARRATS